LATAISETTANLPMIMSPPHLHNAHTW